MIHKLPDYLIKYIGSVEFNSSNLQVVISFIFHIKYFAVVSFQEGEKFELTTGDFNFDRTKSDTVTFDELCKRLGWISSMAEQDKEIDFDQL